MLGLRADRDARRKMSRDENYSPFGPMPGSRVYEPGELLYEFLHGHTRIRCELVDRGEWGVEARILHNEEHHISHTFAPWHVAPFATPRAAAIHWAEEERKAIESEA
jgi:hypothetical protein